ncbi:MAG: hypothetical protein R3268_06220 [Acidiferrobacterales bacterium]|nr:hypothetical protein [Acidiferrobacterales bacterium]
MSGLPPLPEIYDEYELLEGEDRYRLLIDLGRKLFELCANLFDCPVPRSFETPIRNEMPYLFQFTRIKPDPV